MELTTERFGDGTAIDIEVDSDGMFCAEFNDQRYSTATHVELIKQLKRAVKKAATQGSVDVTVLGLVKASTLSSVAYKDGIGVIHAKLRAKHERQYGVWLLASDDGDKRKFQVTSQTKSTIARRLTDAEVHTYLELRQAEAFAEKQTQEFVAAVLINPKDALKGAERREPTTMRIKQRAEDG